jgi:hypothetical protein
MLKILAFSSFSLFIGTCSTVDLAMVNGYVNTNTSTTSAPKLSNQEVISGLKEALQVGIKNAVNVTSITDGFLKNEAIRLAFPPDALKARQKAIDLGMTAQVEKFETTLNRAAEEAAKEALPIFVEAITGMSVQDGFAILNGGNGAATKFLKEQTTSKLTSAFSPKVAEAISRVKLTEYWSPIMTKYNTAMNFTGGEKINPDLNAYVTQKAIEGLFKIVEQEENKIRKDPAARVTDLLAKVFGSL